MIEWAGSKGGDRVVSEKLYSSYQELKSISGAFGYFSLGISGYIDSIDFFKSLYIKWPRTSIEAATKPSYVLAKFNRLFGKCPVIPCDRFNIQVISPSYVVHAISSFRWGWLSLYKRKWLVSFLQPLLESKVACLSLSMNKLFASIVLLAVSLNSVNAVAVWGQCEPPPNMLCIALLTRVTFNRRCK